METRGTVRGRRVELERVPEELDGRRVRVRLEPIEEPRTLASSEHTELWREWAESGPQGPIEDDGDPWP